MADLNDHQARVLDLFERDRGWHVRMLAEELDTTTSGAARTCNVLDRLGLVELVAYPPAEYEITPKGLEWWEANRRYEPAPRGHIGSGLHRRTRHTGGGVTDG